ncbi:MAG: hypothetical protein ACOH1K_04325 [Rhodoglobus sp.]
MPKSSLSRDPLQPDDPRPRLRLDRSLLNRGMIAALVFSVPVFGVLYVIVRPDGAWPAVLATQLATLLLAIAGTIRFFRTAIWIGPEFSRVTERGFFGQLGSFDAAEAESILLAEVYTSDGSESRLQLAVLGANKRRLLRMRGQYWTRQDMDAVVAALDVPVHRIPETVSIGELRTDYPYALYFLERHPMLVALSAVGGTAVTAGLFFLVIGLVRAATA